MKIFKLIPLLFICANLSYALGFNCLNKRFSREMEFLLMKECMGSYNWMTQDQYKQKLHVCSCYIGSLACEYDGEDEKLTTASESGKKLETNEKKYKSCLEGKLESDNKTVKILTKAIKAAAKDLLDDSN